MKTLRKNAGLAAVAAHARALAHKAHATWAKRDTFEAANQVTFSDRCTTERAWEHYSDLNEVACHLERLAGATLAVQS